jgi:hypothetical protein
VTDHRRSPFADLDTGPDEPIVPERPPFLVLAGAVAAVAVAAALVPSDGIPLHLVAYALASLVAIGLVGAFKRIDATRRQSTLYSPVPWADRVPTVVAVLAVVVAAVNVWIVATDLSS